MVASKKSYLSPQLTRHGNVESLTQTYGQIYLTPEQKRKIEEYLRSHQCQPTKCSPCS